MPSLCALVRALVAPLALIIGLGVALLFVAGRASAEPGDAPTTLASEPTGTAPATPRIALLTMGPGDDFVTKFGHDALVVEYPGRPALVYNFGMYTPQSITLPRVLTGNLRYWLAVTPYAPTVALYRAQNRRLVAQELALEPTAARALAAALVENARPENASYRYDYALDNCTTRVRDALDRATGGALRRTLEKAPAASTYRDHALRLTAGDAWLSLLFDMGLGARADVALSGWDDAYLPDRLAAAVRRVTLTTHGTTHALVERETVIFEAARVPVLDAPPPRARWFLVVGIVIAGALIACSRSARREARVGGALLAMLSSFAVGALGLLLLALLLTDVHPVVRPNANILFCWPLALAFVPLAVRVALGRGLRTRRAERLALSGLALALAGVVATFGIGENTAHLALFFVPYFAGLWCFVRAQRRH